MDDQTNQNLASRLELVLKELSLSNFEELDKKLQLPDPLLMESFISALSMTKPNGFFSEKVQFDFFDRILKVFLSDPEKSKEIFKVWSLSGGHGEEAYSVSFLVNEHCGSKSRSRFKIHATDLDIRSLRKAAMGVFQKSELQGLPVEMATKYMTEKVDGNYYVHKEIISGINFTQFNLMNFDHISKTKFHFLFCQNRIKDFDSPTINHVFQMFWNNMAEQSFIFVSEAEAAMVKHPHFKNMGHGIFQRKNGA